jgi:hypothetical protein
VSMASGGSSGPSLAQLKQDYTTTAADNTCNPRTGTELKAAVARK